MEDLRRAVVVAAGDFGVLRIVPILLGAAWVHAATEFPQNHRAQEPYSGSSTAPAPHEAPLDIIQVDGIIKPDSYIVREHIHRRFVFPR